MHGNFRVYVFEMIKINYEKPEIRNILEIYWTNILHLLNCDIDI